MLVPLRVGIAGEHYCVCFPSSIFVVLSLSLFISRFAPRIYSIFYFHTHNLRQELRLGSALRFEFIPSVLSHCQTGKNAPSIKCKCHKKCTGFNDDTIPTTISTMTTTISTKEDEKKIMTCHYTLLCELGKACRPIFNGSKTKQSRTRKKAFPGPTY